MQSNVWFCGNHHNMGNGESITADTVALLAEKYKWAPLTDEFLAGSILKNVPNETVHDRAKWVAAYRAALGALKSLDGLITIITFGTEADEEMGQVLDVPKREWGDIYIASTGQRVSSFSHDTRKQNSPFSALMQWVEDDSCRGVELAGRWGREGRWRTFFLERIMASAAEYKSKAADHMKKAELCSECAKACEDAISQIKGTLAA